MRNGTAQFRIKVLLIAQLLIFLPRLGVSESQEALLVSDIHFNPFYDPSIVPELIQAPVEQWDSIFRSSALSVCAKSGEDVNYPLFQSLLSSLGSHPKAFAYALLPGDFLAHHFPELYSACPSAQASEYTNFVLKTEAFVFRSVSKALKDAPLFPCLGNNDSSCGDYAMGDDDPLYRGLAAEWSILRTSPSARRDFEHGGYYALMNPKRAKMEIIALNDILWSTHYARPCRAKADQNLADPAHAEMNWLEAKLKEAKASHKRVTLLMHIPPGIDAYNSFVAGSQAGFLTQGLVIGMWRDDINQWFCNLVMQYQAELGLGFAGHTHMDDFRLLLGTEPNPSPIFAIHLVPALSPIYGNHPAYQVLLFDPVNGKDLDWKTIDLEKTSEAKAGAWQEEYDANLAYGTQDASMFAYQKIESSRAENLTPFERYYSVRGDKVAEGGKGLPLENPKLRTAVFCAETEWTKDAYQSCRDGK